jgi:hypothetical protein
MLTRREVLQELQRLGITKASQLKTYAKDFERYMTVNHGVPISRGKKGEMAENEKRTLGGKRGEFTERENWYFKP